MYLFCFFLGKIIFSWSSYLREEVQDFLHEIYFLPDHPELKNIHKVLQDNRKVQPKQTNHLINKWKKQC